MNNMFLSSISLIDNNPISILFLILGGLGIFLYGLNLMSSSIESLAGANLKVIVSKATDHWLKGFLIGVILTVLIQSSSATTVIVVGLISAGLLNLRRALPIMIGSHIGSTIMAYIVSIDINVDWYYPVVFIGAFIILLLANRKAKLSGRIIVGFGLLFLGLELMSISVSSFKDESWFTGLLDTFKNVPFLSFLTGTLLTGIIQSSGAFIGIVQEFYISSDSFGLIAALALVIGSNLGTTVTALIASLSGNKESKKASLANTLCVLIGVVIFLPFIPLVTNLFEFLELNIFGTPNKLTIAFFHTFFNIVTAIISLLLIPLIVKIADKIMPDNQKDTISAERLSKELLNTPSVALESVRLSIVDMTDLVLAMYEDAIKYFKENDKKYYQEINEYEEKVDKFEHLLHDYLMTLSETHLNKDEYLTQTKYIDIVRDLERIGDHSVNFSEFLERYYQKKTPMNENAYNSLLEFFTEVLHQVRDTIEAFKNDDKKLSLKVLEREKKIDQMEKDYRRNVHEIVNAKEVSTLDIMFVDIVSNLERISDHTTNICEMIIDPHMTAFND